ncbi:hypothetical protein [Nonomuraea sp. SBT364]|uniref:hypothetical protein n=1 Tax=Nonomuraea sp. SBT364 TaxID=1580530 RepID=UPI0012E258EF|nr:hypothetical protein [Nonomuraea sp. SBT364]
MDSDSLAAAGLLAALSRASGILAELHHPFVRSAPFAAFLPPAGARTGVAFTLPDGREVTVAVSIAASGNALHLDGEITLEGEPLLELPRRSAAELHDALAVLDEYAADVAQPTGRLLDQLLDEIV